MYRITDDRQQQCLEKFFAKEKTWYPDYFGCKFAAYMMFFCGIIGWLFPYQAEWVSIHESIKTYGIYTMIYLLGFSFYSQMFTSYKDSKRNRNLGDCGSRTDIFCDCGITYFFNRKYIDSACGIIRSSGRNLCRGNCG